MSNILFKKNSWGTLKITDTVNPIFIEHEYFGFTDSSYPFDSYQFLRSTSVTDSWHEDNMFVGVPRTMEATIFSSNKGQIANYSVNL